MNTEFEQPSTPTERFTGHVPVTLWQLALLCVATFGFYLIIWFHRTAKNFSPEKPNIQPALYGVGVFAGIPMPFMIAKFATLRDARIADTRGANAPGRSDYGTVVPKIALVLAAIVCLLLFILSSLPGMNNPSLDDASTSQWFSWVAVTLAAQLVAAFMLWGIQKPLNVHASNNPQMYTQSTPSKLMRYGKYVCVTLGLLYWATLLVLPFLTPTA